MGDETRMADGTSASRLLIRWSRVLFSLYPPYIPADNQPDKHLAIKHLRRPIKEVFSQQPNSEAIINRLKV